MPEAVQTSDASYVEVEVTEIVVLVDAAGPVLPANMTLLPEPEVVVTTDTGRRFIIKPAILAVAGFFALLA